MKVTNNARCNNFTVRRALMLTTVTMILALTACGGGGSGGPSKATETKQVEHSWSILGTHPLLSNFVVVPLTKSTDKEVTVKRAMGPPYCLSAGRTAGRNC
jgi:hypothetical protein